MQLLRSVLAWRAGKAGLLAPRRSPVHPGAICKPAGPPGGAPSSGAVDVVSLTVHVLDKFAEQDHHLVMRTQLAGAIPQDGMHALLGDLQLMGTTGLLCFRSAEATGQVEIIGGQLEDDESARDSVEVLLSLREGQYVVYPKLPPLPVSKGNDFSKRGSLAVHPPSELLRYCEEAALSGRLLIERQGRIATAVYRDGELEETNIDDGDASDFSECLAWTDGTFRVDSEAVTQHPKQLSGARAPTTQRSDSTGMQLLRALEHGLSALGLVGADRTATPPPLPQALRAVDTPPPLLAEIEDDDDTIPLARPPRLDEQSAVPDKRQIFAVQRPDGSAWPQSGTTPVVTNQIDGQNKSFFGALGWVALMAAIVLISLGVLSWLGPLE